MEASTSSLSAPTIPSKRVTYVLPRPEHRPPRLVLPDIGTGRHPARAASHKGASSPYVVHHPHQYGDGNLYTPAAHPRHALPVAALAIDPSTSVLHDDSDANPTPKGLLYTAGRDGLTCSWQLGLKMRKRRRISRPSLSSHRRLHQADDVADEDQDDDDENGNDDDEEDDDEKWIFSEHAASSSGNTTPDDWSNLPFERQWEVDPDWLRGPAKPDTHFRSCVQSHTDWVNDMLLCNSNQTVVTASSDRFVRLWNPHDASTALTPAVLGSHPDYVKSLAHPTASSHSPHWIASGGLDRSIRLWDVGEIRKDPIVELCDDASLYCIHTDARGGILAAATPESAIRLYDPRSSSKSGPVGRLLGHSDMVRSVILSKSGRKLLSASSDGTVRLWDVAEQRLIHTFTYHSTSVTALYSNSDELDVFYSGDRDGYICKVDGEDCIEPDEGECVVLARSKGPIDRLVALDDSFVWSTGYGSNVECWRDVPKRAQRQAWYPIQHDDPSGTLHDYNMSQAPDTPVQSATRKDWTRFSIDTFRSDSPSTPGPRYTTADDDSRPRLQSALKSGSSFGAQQAQAQAQSPASSLAPASSPPAMTPHVSFSLAKATGTPHRQLSHGEAGPSTGATQQPPLPLAPDVNPAATLFGIPFDSLVSLAGDDDGFTATGLSTGGVGTGLGSMASGRGSTLHVARRFNDGRRGSSFSLGRPSFALDGFAGSPDVPPAMARLAQLRVSTYQMQIQQQQQREMQRQQREQEQAAPPEEAVDEEESSSQILLTRESRHQSTRSASSIRFAATAQSAGNGPGSLRSPSRAEGQNDATDDQVTQSRLAYEERDLALKAKPLAADPCEIVTGVKGLIRSSCLNDRRHVLTFSSSPDGLRTLSEKAEHGEKTTAANGPEIALWDIVRGTCIGQFDPSEVLALSQYGDTPGDLLEKVKERIEGLGAGAAWCTVDTSCGSLSVHLEFPSAFDTDIYLDECDWIVADEYYRGDQRVNLGKWVLRWLFAGFIEAEVALRQELSSGQLAIENEDAGQPFRLQLPPSKTAGGRPITPGNTVALAMAPTTAAIGPANAPLLTPTLNTTFPSIASLTEAVGTATLSNPTGSSDYFTSRSGGTGKDTPAAGGGEANGPAQSVTPGGKSTPGETAASPGGGLMGRLRFGRTGTSKAAAKAKDAEIEANGGVRTPGGDAAAGSGTANAEASGKASDPPSVSLARSVLARDVTPLPPGEGPELPLHPNTAISISSHSRDAAPWETIYRGLQSSTASDVAVLELASPVWLLETLLNNRTGVAAERITAAKVAFTLSPYGSGRGDGEDGERDGDSNEDVDDEWADESNLPALPDGELRLSATKWLRIERTAAFVCEKLGHLRVSKSRQASIAALSRRPSRDVGSSASSMMTSSLAQSPPSSPPTTEQLSPGDVEVLYNGTVIPAEMTLAQVARYYHRSSSLMRLEYRRKRGVVWAGDAVAHM